MKTGIIVGIVALVLIIGIAGYFVMKAPSMETMPEVPSTQSNTESAASANVVPREGLVEVSISNFAFVPSELKIKVGTKVTWTNNDNTIHTITSDSGEKTELSSKQLDKGEAWAHTFDTPGVYNYHCAIHSGMKGKVVVEA